MTKSLRGFNFQENTEQSLRERTEKPFELSYAIALKFLEVILSIVLLPRLFHGVLRGEDSVDEALPFRRPFLPR